MELEKINGRDIIALLNSDDTEIENLKDEIGYFKFEFEEEYLEKRPNKNRFVICFTVDSDYCIRGNDIQIYEDGTVECTLNEPYDSGGEYREIDEIVKIYLQRLEVDIRDRRIGETLGDVEDERTEARQHIFALLDSIRELSYTDDIFKLRDLKELLKNAEERMNKSQ
jgi:hypothetical protein